MKDPKQDDAWPLPPGISIRQAVPSDAEAIHALLRPYVMQRLLLSRTEAEVVELTRHGFVAVRSQPQSPTPAAGAAGTGPATERGPRWEASKPRPEDLVGFAAVEIYSMKLAELQCLAVHRDVQGTGVGKALVARCVQRARELNVMEVLAISSTENFWKSCGFDYALPDQKRALFYQLRPRPSE